MKLYQLINKLQECPEIYSEVIIKNETTGASEEIKKISFDKTVEIVITEEK